MTNPLPNELLNRIMRFNSHPTADILRPYTEDFKGGRLFRYVIGDVIRHYIIYQHALNIEN